MENVQEAVYFKFFQMQGDLKGVPVLKEPMIET